MRRNLSGGKLAVLIAAAALAVVGESPALPPGLVGYWQAENSSTDTVANSDGILVGGTTYTLGQVGQGFQLDGINDQVRVPDVNAFDVTNITVAFWFRPTVNAIPDDENLVGKDGFTSGNWGFAVDTRGDFVRQVKFRASGGNTPIIAALLNNSDTNASVYLNHFYHVAGTVTPTNINLYINGVLFNSAAFTGPLSVNNLDIFFSGNAALTRYFGGTIDEVRIYGRALSDAEVFEVYSIPEPTTAIFFGIGGILLLCRRKR